MKRQPFVQFATGVLRLSFTPPWDVLLSVCVDGVQPGRLEGHVRDLARQLFGPVDTIDPALRRVLVWRLGRASGKSTVASALAIYGAWTSDLSHVGPGQVPCAFVVSPSKPLAKIAVGIARELVRGTPLERHVEADTADGFTLRRADGRLVEIKSVAASKGGANLRGRDVIVLVLDESEFMSGDDGDFAVTDRDQISAAMPRLLEHVICISTPWPSPNATAEYYDRNWGHPVDAVAALGTSMFMRPSRQLEQDRAHEMARDPDNAAREYDCVPGERGGSRLFVEGLKESVVEGRALTIMAPAAAVMGCGGDLGLERDSSAIAVVSRLEDNYELCEYDEVRPGKGQPLSPRYVIRDRFAPVMRRHGVRAIALDAHYRQSAIEHLTALDLEFKDAPAGQQGKYDSYMNFRAQLRAGKMRLPNDPRLLAQLRAVTATPMAGGNVRISSPRRTGGGHGDVVSALVLAVWCASGGYRMAAQGLFDYYERTYGPGASLMQRPPVQPVPEPTEYSEFVTMVADRIAGASVFSDSKGRYWPVENGSVRVPPAFIEEFTKAGFRIQ